MKSTICLAISFCVLSSWLLDAQDFVPIPLAESDPAASEIVPLETQLGEPLTPPTSNRNDKDPQPLVPIPSPEPNQDFPSLEFKSQQRVQPLEQFKSNPTPSGAVVESLPRESDEVLGWNPSIAQQAQLNAAIVGLLKDSQGPNRQPMIQEARKQLETIFKHKMKARERQIEELEKRVAALRGQLDARQQAQDEIIELKLKTLINQAAGLGF
jgi:hypothetical protein